MDQTLITRIVEAALLAANQPLTVAQLQGLFSLDAPLNASTNAAPDRPAAAAADGWAPVQSNPAFDRSPVTAMLTDHDGNLWVGSNAGLARFRDGQLAEFVPDTHPPGFRQEISAM